MSPLPLGHDAAQFKSDIAYILRFMEQIETQDNVGTARPIIIAVQELKQTAVLNESYHSEGERYNDGLIVWHYTKDDWEFEAETKKEMIEKLKSEEDFEFDPEHDYEDDMGLVMYKYVDVQWFFTHEAANNFIESDKHNLKRPRKYVRAYSYKHNEIGPLMRILKSLPKILHELDWATHMIYECSNHGLTKMMASGIRHQYQFPNYEGVMDANRPAELRTDPRTSDTKDTGN